MSIKVKKLFGITILLVISLTAFLLTINNKSENFTASIVSTTNEKFDEKPAVKVNFRCNWRNMPIRIKADSLVISWTEGWVVKDYKINLNGREENKLKDKYVTVEKDGLQILIDNNSNFLSSEVIEGEILLLPQNDEVASKLVYSQANLRYKHNKLLGYFSHAESTSWQNSDITVSN